MKSLPVILAFLLVPILLQADPAEHTFRILGLFDPDRENDLRQVVATLEGMEMARVDYDTGEATFRFDVTERFRGAKNPEQLVKAFNQMLRQASRGSFEALPRSEFPKEKWKQVKIPIAGHDCRGCSYGAYLAVYKVAGVERATASFHEGFVTVWIDPAKIDRAALEKALAEKKVTVTQ